MRACLPEGARSVHRIGLTALARLAPVLALAALAVGCAEAERPRGRRSSTTARAAPGAPTAPAGGLVASLPSVFGRAIVFDDGPWRCIAINTRASVQSCVHRRRPLDFRYEYVQLLVAGALHAEAPKRGVLLGLGGAGIVHLLRAARPDLHLDTVEIDGAVVTLAERHFGYRPRPGERALVLDAAKFVARPEERARNDLVLLDCFGEHHIPTALLTLSFFEGVRGLLAPGGLLVANLWSTHPQFEAIVKRYRRLYRAVRLVPGRISGNTILVASPTGPLPDRLTVLARARALDARRALPFSVAPHVLRARAP